MNRAEGVARAFAKAKSLADSTSQVSRAAAGLREMLLSGEFRPGERIAEIPLSAKLGVSRTPLRLAFEKLAFEGLLKSLPHSGFAANEFSVDDIWDAIETRGILESAAARIAAERLRDPAELEPLRKIVRVVDEFLKSAVDGSRHPYLDLNESFHSGILELADNRVLQRAVEQVNQLPFGSPSALVLFKSVPNSNRFIPFAQEQHRRIVDAIEHREGARAESLVREHSRVPRQVLELALANRNFRETMPGGHLIRSGRRSQSEPG
jgi:GntR family transcriptional regulator of vanillate catabolism